MRTLTVTLADEAATLALGAGLAQALVPGLLLTLSGELGAGKTTLCRGIVQGLGHRGAVKSPTYTLVEPYEHTRVPVYHFDLYRLGDPEELELLGFRDYLGGDGVCLVEWPERGRGFLPAADLAITMSAQGDGRRVTLEAATPIAGDVLAALDHG
ncbi:tRNA (adenosine(37)-N6)-threonylcarbamoyltransferase complex ATPase subunit type 1 TsaE [Pseudohaliea rubra]|uniref:tRNA threonylcarbamoyladenosine biosynthesis protein TsaE n=1 Tax=Pseudohaliea rubra DSM 19751 TaxID=1265313 RepID=A0A095XZQ1_9GAMM|nr:tRNA (adenosine(37)-N6)-threonylcarbamoyltransferase complex ATPase subunit type 1 TsaE [Pseudohaliea rubra]KGE05251.1 ATPase YjeE, predicted to have essential role in cell wall biosynthesis [Pseudohaliea rubra DSM 19751]